jgi:hypothetical protein
MAGYRTYRHNRIVEYLLHKLPKECCAKETLLINKDSAFDRLLPDI